MGIERWGGMRAQVAYEAARLMYEEGVSEYFRAKRIAANRLQRRVKRKRCRHRDLPSNGEIQAALLELADLSEGEERTQRLFAMRIVALEAMLQVEAFRPRLIGSVSTGHAHRGSDVDIHVFGEDMMEFEQRLKELCWSYEKRLVSIQRRGRERRSANIVDYVHFVVSDVFDIEFTFYPITELRVRSRSSTDGKPIVRVSPRALTALIRREHPLEWSEYQRGHTIATLTEPSAVV